MGCRGYYQHDGSSQQTVSGTGVWKQISQNAGTGVFPGFSINNSAGVVFSGSQSFAVTTACIYIGTLSTTNSNI